MRGLSERVVEAEILDGLAADDPDARESRRDLVWVNALMLQPGIMAAVLRRHVAGPPRRILEIGAGDGSFALKLAGRLAKRWPPLELVLLDRLALATEPRRQAFASLGWTATWVRSDVFEWLQANADEPFDAVFANLFLHHFDDAGLARLFALIKPIAPLLLATEPRRDALSLAASRMLALIGANAVTRHDAPASVRAGFTRRELTGLWPDGAGHVLEERRAGLFSHLFVARTSLP